MLFVGGFDVQGGGPLVTVNNLQSDFWSWPSFGGAGGNYIGWTPPHKKNKAIVLNEASLSIREQMARVRRGVWTTGSPSAE